MCCKQVPLSKRRVKSSNTDIQKRKNVGHVSDEETDVPLRVFIKVTAPKPLVTTNNGKKSNQSKEDRWLLSHHVSNIARDDNLPGNRYMDYRQRKDKETVKVLRRCKSSKPDLILKTTRITKKDPTDGIHPKATQIPVKRDVPIKKSEDKVRKMIPYKSTTDIAADYNYVRSTQSYINNQLYSPPLAEKGFLLKEDGKLQTCVFYLSKPEEEKENRIKTHAQIMNEKAANPPRRDPAPTRIPSPHPPCPCTSVWDIHEIDHDDSCRSVHFDESSNKKRSHALLPTKIHRSKSPETPRTVVNLNKSEPKLDNIMKIESKLDYMMVKPEANFDYVLKAESKYENSKTDAVKGDGSKIRIANGRRSPAPGMNMTDVVGGLLRIKNDRRTPTTDMNFTDILGGIFTISSQKPLEGQKEQKRECSSCKYGDTSPLRPSSPVLTKSEQHLFDEDEKKKELKPNHIKKKKSNIKEKCDRIISRKSTPNLNEEFPKPKVTRTKKVVRVPSTKSLYDYRTVILPYKSCEAVMTT